MLELDECYWTFQQDGAKLHITNAMTEFLKPFFDDRSIIHPLTATEEPHIPINHLFFVTKFSKAVKKLPKWSKE